MDNSDGQVTIMPFIAPRFDTVFLVIITLIVLGSILILSRKGIEPLFLSKCAICTLQNCIDRKNSIIKNAFFL